MTRQLPLRRFTRAVALVLLLVGPAGFPHVGQDDLACAPADMGGDVAQTIAAAPTESAEHCLVCHWARSLRSRSPAFVRVDSVFVAGPHVELPLASPHRAPALDRSPARAPPAAL